MDSSDTDLDFPPGHPQYDRSARLEPSSAAEPASLAIRAPLNSSSSVVERNLLEHIGNTIDTSVIPSSPPMDVDEPFLRPLLPAVQTLKHHMSRHGTDLADHPRKKGKRCVQYQQPLTQEQEPEQEGELDLAIDNDGHVYGYLLKQDKLPSNYNLKLYDEPTYFIVDNGNTLEMKASRIINDIFDNAEDLIDFPQNELSIMLNQLGLHNIPNQLFDFDHYISIHGKPSILIDLSDNQLRSISPKIFTMKNLKMISFRNNKIARLPGMIDHATSLENLNLGLNKFKFLPHNILNLENLKVLALGHNNNLIKLSDQLKYHKIDEELLHLKNDPKLLGYEKQMKFYTDIHWISNTPQPQIKRKHAPISRTLTTLQDEAYDEDGFFTPFQQNEANNVSWTPTLTELILREISHYKISSNELTQWKMVTPKRIYDKSMKALIYGSNGETCGYCEQICVESIGEMLEWWDFKGCKLLTIKRRFCSKSCGIKWFDKLRTIN